MKLDWTKPCPVCGWLVLGPDGPVDYHGLIDFGAYEGGISYDYLAKFTDGRLAELTCQGVTTLNDEGEWVPVGKTKSESK